MVLMVAACGPTVMKGKKPSPGSAVPQGPGARLLSKAQSLEQFKAWNKSRQMYRQYLNQHPDGKSVPLALLKSGRLSLKLRDYDAARTAFDRLIRQYPESPLVPQARLANLESFYLQGRYQEVIRQADDLLRTLPAKSQISQVYLLLGDTYMAGNSPVNAVYFYNKAYLNAPEPDRPAIINKLVAASKPLSAADIRSLLDRVADDRIRGHLMFRLAENHMDAQEYPAARNVLADFLDEYPDHPKAAEARDLLRRFGGMPIAEEHTVGCLLSLSGQYEAYGNKALKGVELALSQFNARDLLSTVKLMVKDSGSDPMTAADKVRELADAGVSAIIGPIITAPEALRAADQMGIPIVTMVQKQGMPQIGEYVFRNFITPQMQVEALVSHAMDRMGLRRFAVLYPEEKYGNIFQQLFWEAVQSRGGEVAAAASYNPNRTDFGGPIGKLRRHRYEALFIPDAPSKAGLILPQLRYYNAPNAQLLGTNLWHHPQMIKMAGEYAQGAIIPEVFFSKSRSLRVGNFVRNYQENFRNMPGFLEAIAYDTAMMVFRACSASQSPRDLREELLRIQGYDGVTGRTSFNADGEAQKRLYLLEIKGSTFQEIE